VILHCLKILAAILYFSTLGISCFNSLTSLKIFSSFPGCIQTCHYSFLKPNLVVLCFNSVTLNIVSMVFLQEQCAGCVCVFLAYYEEYVAVSHCQENIFKVKKSLGFYLFYLKTLGEITSLQNFM
jgi:hypothetical protein